MLLLVGVGISTLGVARYLCDKNQSFYWLSHAHELQSLTSDVASCAITVTNLEDIDRTQIKRVIVSPGIKPQESWISAFDSHLIYTDWEYFCHLGLAHGKKTVAITGTNGKSTLVSQVVHIMKKHGVRAVAVGNIGVSPFDCLGFDVYVIELSSFQLHYMRRAQFDVGCICNLAPDHLDWHVSLDDYYAAKHKLIAFSEHMLCEDEVDKAPAIVQRLFGAGSVEDLSDFVALAHRFSPVMDTHDWLVINDSKATNLASSTYALRRLAHNKRPVFLLCGGVLKEEVCQNWLQEVLRAHVIPVFMGECRQLLHEHVQKGYVAQDLADAISWIGRHEAGILLFSPGCASFDMFKNYSHRGEAFTKEVEHVFQVGR